MGFGRYPQWKRLTPANNNAVQCKILFDNKFILTKTQDMLYQSFGSSLKANKLEHFNTWESTMKKDITFQTWLVGHCANREHAETCREYTDFMVGKVYTWR